MTERWESAERVKWDAMTEDERWRFHLNVRANRANAKLAADRLDYQLEQAATRITQLEADLARERAARRIVDEALRDALAARGGK